MNEIPAMDYTKASMITVDDASRITAFLDPFRAVLAKDSDLVISLSQETIRITAVDPSHVVLIRATVILDTMPPECIKDVIMHKGTVGVPFVKFYEALKSFGTEEVRIVASHDRLYIDSDMARRTMATTDTSEWKEPRIPNLDCPFEAAVSKATMDRIVGCDVSGEMADALMVKMNADATWSMVLGEDREIAEVYCPKGFYLTQQTEASRAYYSKDIIVELIRRIHSKEFIFRSGNDYPCEMIIGYANAKVYVLVAPTVRT